MVAAFSIRKFVKNSKFALRVFLLVLMLVYVLPRLLLLLWDAATSERHIPDQQILEKPLRVEYIKRLIS